MYESEPLYAGNRFSQRTLPFAHEWEIPPDLVEAGTETVPTFLKRLDARHRATQTGLAEVASKVDGIVELLTKIREGQDQLDQVVAKRSIVDDEVRRYRNEEIKSQFQLPFFRMVIRRLDQIIEDRTQIERFGAQLKENADPLARAAIDWARETRELEKTDLRNYLAEHGIDWFWSKRDTTFDPDRHKWASFEITDRRERDGRIARHQRYGYLRACDDWLIRPEIVTVFKFEGNVTEGVGSWQ